MSGFHGERGGVTTLRATPARKSKHDTQDTERLPYVQSSERLQQHATTHVDAVAQSELLQNAVFPTWKDDGATEGVETPEELQKNDPLGTQIWKLYSRTKTRLPNQERMENLTWRMMAMNLRKREKEQALYVHTAFMQSLY